MVVGKDNVAISRNQVSTENSEVDIYLDKAVLDCTIDEYQILLGRLFDWGEAEGLTIELITDSSSGEASYEISYQDVANLNGDFTKIINKTSDAISIMEIVNYA